FELANGAVQALEHVVGGVAHIDAEDIRTGNEQILDDFGAGRGRPQSGNDLDAATAPHWVWLPFSAPVLAPAPLVSGAAVLFSPVSETVQSVSSRVSTSKNPVFW